MANKARDYDNTPFLRIAGKFGDYDNDLTPEAKQIIDEAIASVPMGNGKPYSGFKIYYIVFNLITFSTEKVLARLHLYQDYHIKEVQERVSESTAVKVRRVATAVSKALVAAHKRKVKLFKVQKDGMHYIDNKQFYETLANAHDSGASAEELIIILQGFIDGK